MYSKIAEYKPTKEIDVDSIVQLKSGGPKMTVEKIDNTWSPIYPISCVWIYEGRLRRGQFSPDVLNKSYNNQ